MSTDRDLSLYLDALYGAEPAGGFIEIRFKRLNGGRGMEQEFIPCEDRREAGAFVRRAGKRSDTYIGVAPRRRRSGGGDAVERVHALFVDADSPESREALERFSPRPAIVIRSGSGAHAYWPLWPPLGPDEAKSANRRLAYALRADMLATDAARILRPPGTFNWKTGKPVPVTVARAAVELFTVEQVVGGLPDPEPPAPAREIRHFGPDHDDPLRDIPPALYVEILTGRAVGRDGKIACPFHDDRTPSLHVYEDPDRGWMCFGCDQGGDIYNFGAALYGLSSRTDFPELRRRLLDVVLGEAA